MFVLSVFTYTVSNSNSITEISAISNFYYSDNIVPDETLTWQVAKFEIEDKGDPWTVKTGKTIGKEIRYKSKSPMIRTIFQ
ncbi:MAG: hypothetical protein ACTSR6_06525 [Candidatus Heimdallarchaeota archaeon]